jgi:EmrB/QacA subfamily drug resistance transporter
MTASRVTSAAPPPWAALPVVLAGIFVVVLDFFIVNVALPAMQSDLGAGPSELEWIVAGYGLTTGVGLIPAGRLGDRHGRRAIFTLGIALFTVASAACGLAPDAGTLIGARLVQGAAAALLMPQVLAIVGVAFTGPARARAIGAYGMVMGVAALGGQLIGGVLVQWDVAGLGWRACFLINVPIGIAAVALAPRLVPESRAPRRAGLDLGGTALVTAGLTGVLLPLIEGRREGWPAWTWLCLTGAAALLAAFARRQRRLAAAGADPLVDPALVRLRPVAAGLAAQLVFWCTAASFFLVLALYLQDGRGLDPIGAGLAFTILAGAYLVASLVAPGRVARHGRRVVMAGAVALAAGYGALLVAVAGQGAGGPIAALAPGLLLVGAGMGLLITPLVSVVLADVGEQWAGAASAALSTVQSIGNAIGVAVVGVVYFDRVGDGVAPAFEASLAPLMALAAAILLPAAFLPRPARRAEAAVATAGAR